ncbi:uncharacterized protein LOC123675482 [Harmonia axyridis]|uniref:uncharacterized protein LOC123675482 n=1 Tax=Harmonia axyridis TaxID=115357 RepID=UPI001E27538F|nr:uncharacterized protein LOC123675482 [Harmonia axyridis]
MDALRRSARISRMERIRNQEVRNQMGVEGTIMDGIERKQLIWYGHVQRMGQSRLPKITMEWIPNMRRRRGRPRKNWMEEIRNAMRDRNLQAGQWKDRKQWILGIGQRRRTF